MRIRRLVLPAVLFGFTALAVYGYVNFSGLVIVKIADWRCGHVHGKCTIPVR